MQFGIYLNPSTPGPEHDGRRVREVVRQCRLAESLGYSSIWLTEQHFTPYNTYSDSIVMAAHLAAAVPSMLIGFAVLVPSLHHPVRLAEQLGLLDQLTNGKLVVGMGVGAGGLELAGFGRDFHERHELFDEAAELLTKLWKHDDGLFEYHTPSYQGKIEGRIIPRPLQTPHPPIARATRDPGRAEAWGETGQPILMGSFGISHIRTMLDSHARGLARAPIDDTRREQIKDLCAIHHVIYVSDTDEKAREEFMPWWDNHLVYHYYANRGLPLRRDELPPDSTARYTAEQLIVGSPETVVAKLQPYVNAGIRHHMIWANVGNCPTELVERSLTLLAERVVPQLKVEG